MEDGSADRSLDYECGLHQRFLKHLGYIRPRFDYDQERGYKYGDACSYHTQL